MLESALVHTQEAFQVLRHQWFWFFWITTTAVTVLSLMLAMGTTATSTDRRAMKPGNPVSSRPRLVTPAFVILSVVLIIIVALYVKLSFFWEDFNYDSYSMFTLGTLRGHDIAPPIWRGEGRFFPLGFQEFNLIRHFTNTVFGYHLLPIAELFIVVLVLFVIDDELRVTHRVALTIVVLVTPSILLSFIVLVALERNIILFLVLLILFVRRFDRTLAIPWAVAAILSAQFLLYYKETAFVLLSCFAATRLVLRSRVDGGWHSGRLWRKESYLDFCLVALAILFLVAYFIAMGIHGNMNYAVENRKLLSASLLRSVICDLLGWLLVVMVLGRAYRVLRCHAAPSPLWDGLALGAVAYAAAYFVLRLYMPLCLAPVDLVAVLYLGRLVVLAWEKLRPSRRLGAAVLAFVVLLQSVSVSAMEMFEEKNILHANTEIASIIRTRYLRNPRQTVTLFFPYATPFLILEFAAYLEYRGLPAEPAGGGADESGRLVFATNSVVGDGPCMSYVKAIRCRAAGAPAPGDLVILLPDAHATFAEVSAYRDRGTVLFSYEPRPAGVPRWLYSLYARYDRGPDRWLLASVAVWQ
jgi:hypothetical protein